MKYKYDLHIHSGLSPCAEKEMTPVNITAYAKLSGLDFVAIADHNAIANVEVALRAGEFYGINVVPAMELQTAEDIHLLCLFEKFEELEAFYLAVPFPFIKNRPDIFGEQLIFDEDDNIIGKEERLLLNSSTLGIDEARRLCERHGGVAIPAHIDRDSNSALMILGVVPEEFKTVEISSKADDDFIKGYEKDRLVIINSDAHMLDGISLKGEIELNEPTVKALIERLKEGK